MDKERLKEIIKKELLRRECLSSYERYVEKMYEGEYIKTAVSRFLCGRVQSFVEKKGGASYDIMIISMPPQHGKSMLITATLPSWYLLKKNKGRVICISYGEKYAAFFGRRNREKLKNGEGIFGRKLKSSPSSVTEFETLTGGSMISRGILSGITGRGCDLMIIDDPVKNRAEADSEIYRKRIFDEWENSFKTRLSAGAKVIVIQTRWHEEDLAGQLMKTEKSVEVINLPCEAEEGDLLKRAIGEPLCPELGKGREWLLMFKESYKSKNGSRAWNALFQGRPGSSEGGIIKRSWWRFYKSEELCEEGLDHLIISVDAAFKGEKDSDFVAIQAWGKKRNGFYLIDGIKARLDFPETVKAVRKFVKEHPTASHILIEDKANGSAIIQTLKRELPRVIGVNPKGGKLARVNAVCGVIEAGNVYLPKDKDFVGDFIEECTSFPRGRNDDQVDCMSQALSRLCIYSEASDKSKGENPFEKFNLGGKENRNVI